MKLFRTAVAASLLYVTLIGPASAVNIYVEGDDAGATLGSAADATWFSPLHGIEGAVSLEPNTGPDYVDMYAISLSSQGWFRALTGIGFDPFLIADPVLFLFDAMGKGIAMDDESGGEGQAALTTKLMAGTYYLAITYAGVEPLDSDGASIFDAFDTLAVLSSNPLAAWLESPFAVDPSTVGAYRISISLVPEPGMIGLTLIGLLGVGALRRRRAA
jgi:hypothetical protein